MAAATKGRDSQRKMSDRVAYLVAAATTIYQETLVSTNAAGYAIPARTGTGSDIFQGVAYDGSNNSTGSAGATSVLVRKSGTYIFALAGAVQANIGAKVYTVDDSTVTLTSGTNQLVGTICDIIDGNNVRVKIDLAVA